MTLPILLIELAKLLVGIGACVGAVFVFKDAQKFKVAHYENYCHMVAIYHAITISAACIRRWSDARYGGEIDGPRLEFGGIGGTIGHC